ncbi:ATP-dependent Clp protease ATP-binding subunit [Listeria rocourtiae FSL F6-920]|nr:ATP-dependent Clp protease ATP-binding subunit [Listeria rocourtiae FSL F6-920]
MEMQKFTQQVQEMIASAQQLAIEGKQQQIDTLHVFVVLLEHSDFAKRVYEVAGVDTKPLLKTIELEIEKLPSVTGSNVQYGQAMSSSLYELIADAEKERQKLEDDYVSTEHLLLAVMEQKKKPSDRSSRDFEKKN